ncbi:MAG: TolC family protein, partial [Acidobacteria bacterium]
ALASELTAAVREQYARLYAVDRERAVLGDALQIADLLVTTASSRYAAGESDQASVLRTQLERTRLGERIADLDGERAVLAAGLNRLTDDPPGTAVAEVTALPEFPALEMPLDLVPDLAATAAPQVAVRQSEVALAGDRIAAARAELKSNLSLGGGIYWQGNTDRVVTFTVGIDLPFRRHGRQGPMIAATEREAEAARLELADAAAAARTEAAQLVAEIRRAEAQLVRYRTGLLPQSSAALDAARAGYLGGRGEFAAALDEFRRWTEIRVEVARREAARFAALGRLHALVSRPAEGKPTGGVQPTPKENVQ